MKTSVWRHHTLSVFRLGSLILQSDGCVQIGVDNYRSWEAIDVPLDGENNVWRPAGHGQFLMIQRPGNLPLVFRYCDGAWEQWVRMFGVNPYRFYFRRVVQYFGLALPFYFVGMVIAIIAVVRTIMTFHDPQTPTIFGLIALAAVAYVFGRAMGR